MIYMFRAIHFELMYLRTWEIYELDSEKKFSAAVLSCQTALRKPKVKLDLLTNIGMLLMVKKVLEDEYVTPFTDIQKLKTNAWNIMIKIKNRHIYSILRCK